MLKNYFKITFRSLWKNKVYVIINILGLGVAMACCIVAYLNYNFGASFDADQEDISGIYRIDSKRNLQGYQQLYGFTPIPLGALTAANVGEVDDVLRIMPSGSNFKVGDESFSENITYTEPGLFDFFSFDMISGDPGSLAEQKNILISDEIAAKYFPGQDPVGQILTRQTSNGPADQLVSGVFQKKPMNSTFGGFSVITHLDNYFKENPELENNWENWITTFVKVDDPASIPLIEKQLNDNYIEIQNAARFDFRIDEYTLEPFEGMPARAEAGEVWAHWFWTPPPPPAMIVPGIMAILILLIACFNFTNTSMAIAGKRLKEIGLRKVMGGLRKQLIVQFMLENLMLCAFALIISLVIAWFLVPAYSAMWPFIELELDITGNYGFYMFLVLVLLATGLLAGSYPAFYVSKFDPAAILKRNLKYGGTSWFTNTLLGAQFTVSLIAIMFGVIFYQNARYQESLDVGFDARGTISLYFENPDEFLVYKNRVDRDPRILTVAGSEHQMNRSYRNDPVTSGDKEFDTDIFHIGEGYFETMGYALIEGRKFRTDSRTDMQESVIVSEEMVRRFGWEEPLGQKVVWMDTVSLYVVGVMKDVYTQGFWDSIRPLMLRYVGENDYSFMTIKFPARETLAVNEYLEDAWREVFADRPYTGQFLDDSLSESATINNNILIMFGSLGIIATFLSAMGLFSLVSLSILKRMKEIGVRKVLGASVSNIMRLINQNYLVILVIASLLASIASYYLSIALMDSIWAHHITPGFLGLILCVVIMFFISIFTVGFKVFRAATANPTETIRME